MRGSTHDKGVVQHETTAIRRHRYIVEVLRGLSVLVGLDLVVTALAGVLWFVL